MTSKKQTSSEITLGSKKLKKFFVDHLDRIYCAKQHMVKRFPELAKLAVFADLDHAVTETIDDIKKQIARMDKIYHILEEKNSTSNCNGLIAMLDEAMIAIHDLKDDASLRDMAILFYMQNLESIEVASFQVLQIVAKQLNNPDIKQLILENFDEAQEDRTLLLHITAKYVAS